MTAKKAETTKQPETVPTPDTYIGVFDPKFGFQFEELVLLIKAFGLLNTPPFTGTDAQGNFTAPNGKIVVPAGLARYFTPTKVG